MTRIPIVGFAGYYIDYPAICNKHGKPLKDGLRGVITLYDQQHVYKATRWKIIWAAQHGIDPRKIPRAYSFREDNGTVLCETFSDRMSDTVKQRHKMATVKWQDYDFIERFAHTAKEMLQGDGTARMKLFTMLNQKRDELIKYARYAVGGVSLNKATDYTDQAIFHCYETIINGCYHVPSPIASIKWHIRKQIRDGRNKR
jgi:hypothetical protein